MKKVIRLTESNLQNLILRIISEQSTNSENPDTSTINSYGELKKLLLQKDRERDSLRNLMMKTTKKMGEIEKEYLTLQKKFFEVQKKLYPVEFETFEDTNGETMIRMTSPISVRGDWVIGRVQDYPKWKSKEFQIIAKKAFFNLVD